MSNSDYPLGNPEAHEITADAVIGAGPWVRRAVEDTLSQAITRRNIRVLVDELRRACVLDMHIYVHAVDGDDMSVEVESMVGLPDKDTLSSIYTKRMIFWRDERSNRQEEPVRFSACLLPTPDDYGGTESCMGTGSGTLHDMIQVFSRFMVTAVNGIGFTEDSWEDMDMRITVDTVAGSCTVQVDAQERVNRRVIAEIKPEELA